jgi:glycerol-3-phosphate dehydrogenase
MLRDAGASITFEEAQLCLSDAQFVMGWLSQAVGPTDRQAINYTELVRARWEGTSGVWRIELCDVLDGREAELRAACIVNAAGVWADRVQERCGVLSPWRHALSKGVSLSVPRHPCHHATLLFDGVGLAQGYSLVPWGPVSLWGSTETWAVSLDEGFRPTTREIHDLLRLLNQHLALSIRPCDVVSLRCGIRPLVVRCGERTANLADPLTLSRRSMVWRDRTRPWVTIYGGKLTGAPRVAERVRSAVQEMVSPSAAPPRSWEVPAPPVETDHLCGFKEPVPAARWCREHAQCWTLEDYLRRRTNIAQWVPRGGFGRHDEYDADLLRVAMALTGNARAARRELDHYRYRIATDHDAVLSESGDASIGPSGTRVKEQSYGTSA